ncbi:MAG: HAD family hydrolase [Candidatus Omnitrophica bacterium]|nr:HAD family hydrolase [Candidatus Omnitrophota bacterium]
MIKTIFFDFDGVIVESVDIKTAAFARLFKAEGKDAVGRIVDYHLKNAGVSRFDKFRLIYRDILKRPLGEEEFHSLCGRFAGLVMDEVVGAPFVKGAKEFLENHASRYLCCVVSATPQEEIEEIARRKGIARYFKKIYGAPSKKTDIVKKALSEEGTDPSSSAYVGDAMSDYEAAVANRSHFIARINKNEDIFRDIDCVKIRDLSGLQGVLEKIGRQ